MSPSRDEPLTIRFSAEDRELLQAAAKMRGVSESAFVREASVEAARALGVGTAWQRAVARFKDVYGSEFDARDETDVHLLGELVEDEVRREITAKINAPPQSNETAG